MREAMVGSSSQKVPHFAGTGDSRRAFGLPCNAKPGDGRKRGIFVLATTWLAQEDRVMEKDCLERLSGGVAEWHKLHQNESCTMMM